MNAHVHVYQNHDKGYLICHGCTTITTIRDAIKMAESRGRIAVMSDLLMSRELKKSAHDRIYNFVMANKDIDRRPNQARLLDV